MGGRMLVICVNNEDTENILKLNKIYSVKVLGDYVEFSGWWSIERFRKVKLYPNTKIFRELYPDAIEYQGYLGVNSEIKL